VPSADASVPWKKPQKGDAAPAPPRNYPPPPVARGTLCVLHGSVISEFSMVQVRGEHGVRRARHISLPVWLEMGPSTAQGNYAFLDQQLTVIIVSGFVDHGPNSN